MLYNFFFSIKRQTGILHKDLHAPDNITTKEKKCENNILLRRNRVVYPRGFKLLYHKIYRNQVSYIYC